MERDIEGRVTVITGGATGIGLATARQLCELGGLVVIAGRDADRGAQAVADLTACVGSSMYVHTDVRHEDDVRALFQTATDEFGGVDFVFNNAGIVGELGPLARMSEEGLDDLLATNVKGVYLGMKYGRAALHRRGGGVIVNTASFMGTRVAVSAAVAYGATKAAVVSMTHSAMEDLRGLGIDAYAVCPWIIDSPMIDRLVKGDADAKLDLARTFNPSDELASADDVARVVVELFQGRTAFLSGDAILVDAGGAQTAM